MKKIRKHEQNLEFQKHFLKSQTNFKKSKHILDILNLWKTKKEKEKRNTKSRKKEKKGDKKEEKRKNETIKLGASSPARGYD